MQMFWKIGLAFFLIFIGCLQIFLLAKFFLVKRALLKLQEQSSGDHERYNNHTKDGNGNPRRIRRARV